MIFPYNKSSKNELVELHELFYIAVDRNRKILMGSLSSQYQYLKFFINLYLNTDITSMDMFGIHIKLEYGVVFLISRSHEKKSPHFI